MTRHANIHTTITKEVTQVWKAKIGLDLSPAEQHLSLGARIL